MGIKNKSENNRNIVSRLCLRATSLVFAEAVAGSGLDLATAKTSARRWLANGGGGEADFSAALLTMMP
jgi:hypothetical protein